MLALALALVALPAVAANAADGSGAQRFVITGTAEYARVAASGVVNATGVDVPVSLETGPGNTLSGSDRLEFADGDMYLSFSGSVELFSPDPDGCVTRIRFNGTWEITGGTGSFSGATGSGSFTDRELLRYTGGADGCGPDYDVVLAALLTGQLSSS